MYVMHDAKRGEEMLIKGDFEGALKIFDSMLEKDGKDPDAWNGKGAALRSMGRYDEAAKCFEISLKLDPRDRAAS